MWLVRELEEDERPALFRTMVTSIKKIEVPPTATPGEREAPPAGAARRRAGSVRPLPLSKSGSNPWSDRILVGRASNNDVVLRNDRISKLHAWFQVSPRGVWRVYDARSANGTRIDGDLVPPGEEGLEVESGQVVMFGTVATRLLSSGELYDAL
jgi:pSer/pThr/pTyr-binding forkhead associated (FHA) protein